MIMTYRPNDPLYTSQWHLSQIGRLGFGTSSNTTGLERIWAEYTGEGVHVGIWDDGSQATHWDIDGNYDASRQVTINGTLNNGQPLTAEDGHGTSVAGLIAAENNGLGGVGVAFNAGITTVRIFGGADDINSNWSRYLQTLDHLGDFDVTNHSYGGYPSFYTYGDVAKFEAAAENGRGGLGTVNVKSAGNSNIDGNGEALDASRFTVTVAALGTGGQITSYSTYGAHVLVSAPAASVTTDLLGTGAGYNGLLSGDYTNQFGGTSAAGPVTAGVVTLMLEANSGLGWRDVQNILSYSATGTGSLYTGVTTNENSAWKWNGGDNWNGGGLHFSEDYGYGMVNAYNAVRMAEIWSILNPEAATSANEAVVTTGTIGVNRTIADLSTLSYSFTVNQDINLEHVDMTIGLTHSYFTDLKIRLISPDNTVMTLYDGSTGSSSTSDYGFSYSFGLEGLRGEHSAGTWTIQIQDAYGYDTGILTSLNFTGYGSALTAADTYHYTDEVLTVLAQSGQADRLVLTDGDGGIDWIDAAAMYRNLYLDLNAGSTSTLAGTAFLTVAAATAIENAIAGDGNDLIVGNELDNLLYGMRGDDDMNGYGGVDTAAFIGCLADYTVTYENGVTTVVSKDGRFGTDTLVNFEFLKFDDQTIADPSSGMEPPIDETAPTLTGISPENGAAEVLVGANIVLTFSEAVQAGEGNIVIYNGDGSVWSTIAITDTSQVTVAGQTVTINPTANLAYTHEYYVLVGGTAITDLEGNAFTGISDPTELSFVTSANIITGTSAANTLVGTSEAEFIYGLSGNDVLYGNNGNDVLDGGAGNDSMAGGFGDDSYYVDSRYDTVIEAANAGTDTVTTTLAAYTIGANVENLTYTGASAFLGTGNALNNTITGGTGNDTLTGNAGNDILNGGAGVDRLVGGAGNDTYYVDSWYDAVVESKNAGIDTVACSSASFALGANVENLIYTGASAFYGVGNTLGNAIYGGTGNDTLVGNAGNDTLYGGAGADLLYAGTGLDHLYGGADADRFVYSSTAEAGKGAARDVIDDFQSGDLIDLSGIDANTKQSGNQAFTYISASAFSGVKGSLRYANGILSGDVNGDRVADFEIQILGAPALSVNDFIL